MRMLIVGLMLLGLVSDVSAQVARNQAPNVQRELESYTERYREAWELAHRPGGRGDEWIQLAVATLRAEHPGGKRWCVNGKRGTSEISQDVVAYLVNEANGDFRMVEAYDVIRGAGGANPQVSFDNITNYATIGQAGTAVCIVPRVDVKPPVGPVDPVDPQPVDDLTALLAIVQRLEIKLDALAGVAVQARDQANDAKIVAQAAFIEAEQAKINSSDIRYVDVPKLLEQFKPSCVTGKVPKAFGGSATVTLCPPQ